MKKIRKSPQFDNGGPMEPCDDLPTILKSSGSFNKESSVGQKGILQGREISVKSSSKEKRHSSGDALSYSRQSLQLAEANLDDIMFMQTNAYTKTNGSDADNPIEPQKLIRSRKIRKSSTPEKPSIGHAAGEILAQNLEESTAKDDAARLANNRKSRSYDKSLITKSIANESQKELDPSPPTHPKLSRKISARILKKNPTKDELVHLKKEFNETFDQIFGQHGHYKGHGQEKAENIVKWVTKIQLIREHFFMPIKNEVDLKVASLARISLLKAYIEKVNPPKSTIKKMIQEFYSRTIYHHHGVDTSVGYLLEARSRFPADLVPILEEEIILHAPAPHLAHYLFKRMEEIHATPENSSEGTTTEGRENSNEIDPDDYQKAERLKTVELFAYHLNKRSKPNDVVALFEILFENDIQQQLKSEEAPNQSGFENLFREGWFLSILLLQAYERIRFPDVIYNLIDSFETSYIKNIQKNGGIFKWFKHKEKKKPAETQFFYTSLDHAIEQFCDSPLDPEFAKILQALRKKLDAYLKNINPFVGLDITLSIFVLRLMGNVIQKEYIQIAKERNFEVALDVKVLYDFSKWLLKCLIIVVENQGRPRHSPMDINLDDPQTHYTHSRHSITQSRFYQFMNKETGYKK
jgi:hypothetical protein